MRRAISPSLGEHRAFFALVAATAFFWAGVLSVSPGLHERIHSDANRLDHSCAVTFVSSGQVNHSAPVPFARTRFQGDQFLIISVLDPQWVPSLFLEACIFEHAPPVPA
jgi:hypothetical protein